MMLLFVVSNMAITLAYLMLGLYVAPRFDLAGAPLGVSVTKYAMLAFFLFCAMTHMEQVYHVINEPRATVEWMLSWHMVISHFLQALAAPIAAVFTTKYLSVTLGRQRH